MMRIGKSREYVWTLEDNFPPIFCEISLGYSGRYPVYRSTTTGDFLYLYDWGKGLGMNWFISLEVSKPNSILLHLLTATTTPYQVNDNNRGIESPDLEKVEDRCPEKVTHSPHPLFTQMVF